MCSGITSFSYSVLKGELYAHRVQRLIFLHLITELCHEDISSIIRKNAHETVL